MAIRVLHTSDWHLGKKLFKQSRLDEQKKFLTWLIETILNQKINYVLVSGDIFDSPGPTNEACKLYYDFLQNLHSKTNAEIIIIGGNHDSGAFLDAPSTLLESKRIHIKGQLSLDPSEHLLTLVDPDQKNDSEPEHISLVALPYFRGHQIQHYCKRYGEQNQEENPQEESLRTLENMFREIEEIYQLNFNQNKRIGSILMAHHIFGNFEMSGSELNIALSGLSSIPTKTLGNFFDYVALGHIHKPQKIKGEKPRVQYSGSPIALRFSEKEQKKISIIEFKSSDNDSNYIYEEVEIPQFRRLISIKLEESNWREDLKAQLDQHKVNKETELLSFIEVFINLKAPIAGITDEIRLVIEENHCRFLNIQFHFGEKKIRASKEIINRSQVNTTELFKEYYKTKINQKEIPEKIMTLFQDLLEETRTEEHDHEI